jgi:hypothetical protein
MKSKMGIPPKRPLADFFTNNNNNEDVRNLLKDRNMKPEDLSLSEDIKKNRMLP